MSENIKGREKGKGRRMMPNRRWCMFTTIRRYLVLQSIKTSLWGTIDKNISKKKDSERQWRSSPDRTPGFMTENKLHM